MKEESLYLPDDQEKIVASLRKLIAKIEAGEVVVQSYDRSCMIEEIEPKNNAKQFRVPGCYVTVILYRRNGPAKDLQDTSPDKTPTY